MEATFGQIETSSSIGAFAAAFVAAQAQISNATKDSTNPHFKSKYADLASVMDACKKPLNDNGIGILQFPVPSAAPTAVTIRTVLMHKSGEWMASVFVVPTMKSDAQGVGSAMTYARRYALAAITGVCPEDDDGNAASNGKPEPRQAQRPQQATGPVAPPKTEKTVARYATEAQLNEISELLERVQVPDGTVDRWLKKAGVTELRAMLSDDIAKCILHLRHLENPQQQAA